MKSLIKRIPYIRRLHRVIEEQQRELQRWRTWQRPGHFYSPIPSLDEVRKYDTSLFQSPERKLPGIDLNEDRQLQLLSEFRRFHDDTPFPDNATTGFRYHFRNSYFSYADAIALYSMLRLVRPRRIVEVGSGFSSALMLDTNDRYLDRRMRLTFIDPYPERLESLLSSEDAKLASIVRLPVQDVPLSLFEELEHGDVLFVDSSHVSKTGSDVNFLVFEVLPRIKSGVYVHFHDVFYPFEYPRNWVHEGVAWNEAYLLHAFLAYNSAYQIQFFVSYLLRCMRHVVEATLPTALKSEKSEISLYDDAPGGSLWLLKTKEG